MVAVVGLLSEESVLGLLQAVIKTDKHPKSSVLFMFIFVGNKCKVRNVFWGKLLVVVFINPVLLNHRVTGDTEAHRDM